MRTWKEIRSNESKDLLSSFFVVVGYGLKLHNSVGVHPIIPQLPSDHSPILRSTPTPSSGTTSPHSHPVHTPTTSSGASLPHPSDTPETPVSSASLLSQMNQLGPSERCTPSQAVSMGQQLLAIIAQQERGKMALPSEYSCVCAVLIMKMSTVLLSSMA